MGMGPETNSGMREGLEKKMTQRDQTKGGGETEVGCQLRKGAGKAN